MSYHGVIPSRPVTARPARRLASPRVDYETLADLRYHIRRFLRVREEAARAAGVEPQQYVLLLQVKGFEGRRPATIGALTERLQIRHHATVQLVDRLAQRGMVRRRRVKLDRRGVVVELTARGEAVLRKLALNSLTELRTAGRALAATLTRAVELDGADRPRMLKSKEARDS
jgi:DNA-binding MarR family transcriptional regulator